MAIDNIHVYYCDMRQFNIDLDLICRFLNEADQRRYQGIKNTSRKRQFAMARWLIKHSLKRLFALSTSHDYQLIDHCCWRVLNQESTYSVSISHSGHYVAVAIAGFPCSIGIDIEQHKQRNFSELVKAFSTPDELNLVCNHADQQSLFYRLWTAKEAFLKVTQRTIDQVSQENLAICLLHQKGKVAGYHYLMGHVIENAYSYSVMTNADATIHVQEFVLNQYNVEP